MDTAMLLYRRLDSLFSALDPKKTQPHQLEMFLEEAFVQLKDDLRLKAGFLYAERRDDFTLAKAVGDPSGRVAETLDPATGPLQQVFRHRVYIFGDPNAEIAPYRLSLFPLAAAAGLVVGRRPRRHVFFFLLAEGWVMEELDFALNTVRAALGSRLVDARVRGSFREAAEIQQSLLVEEPPHFPGYDIACRSVPAEEVGGDFYDFHPFNGDMLGLAIGDATGHGGNRHRTPPRAEVPPRLRPRTAGRGAGGGDRRHPGEARRQGRVLRPGEVEGRRAGQPRPLRREAPRADLHRGPGLRGLPVLGRRRDGSGGEAAPRGLEVELVERPDDRVRDRPGLGPARPDDQ